MIVSSASVYSQTPYDNGWKTGYQEGYCYQVNGCIPPIAPVPPIPLVGENRNDYKAGYQRGFLTGQQARQNTNSNTNQNSSSSYLYQKKEVTPYIQPYDIELIERSARYNQERLDAQRARNQQVYDYNLGLINQAVANFNNKINQLPENVFNSYSNNVRTMANELNALMNKTNIVDGNSVRYLLNRVNSYAKTMDNWEFLTSLGTSSVSRQTSTDGRQSTTNKPDAYIGKQIYLYDGAQLYYTPTESGKIDKYTGGLVYVVEKVNNTLYYKVLYNNRYYYVSSVYMKPLTINNVSEQGYTNEQRQKQLEEHRKIIGE